MEIISTGTKVVLFEQGLGQATPQQGNRREHNGRLMSEIVRTRVKLAHQDITLKSKKKSRGVVGAVSCLSEKNDYGRELTLAF